MAEAMFETDDVVAAEDALDSIFKEKHSVIDFVKDRYKRSVGECFLKDESLSVFMVRNGYAFDWPYYSEGKFANDQKYAKMNSLGIWNMKFEYPWEWKEKIRKNK